MSFAISADFVGSGNAKANDELADDYAALGRQLARRHISIKEM